MNDEVRPLPVFVSEKATVTYIKVRPSVRLRQHRRTEVMFPDDPSTLPLASPPRSSLPLPSQPPSPACSPLAPLFLLLAASFSRFTLLLCPSPSLSLFLSLLRTLFPLSPSSSFASLFFTSLDVGAKRDASLQSFERSAAEPRIESHTWRRFSSALRPLRAPTLGYADAPLSFSFFLRAVPSFSSTCGVSRYFTPERTYRTHCT